MGSDTMLDYGFRPFFLGAATWGLLSVALWLPAFFTGYDFAVRMPPVFWHMHEMIFGFIGAAMAGFLLTAVPNWTGRDRLHGVPLLLLFLLWLGGRLVLVVPAFADTLFAAAVDWAFFLCLLIYLVHEVIKGRNWRNLVISVPVVLLLAGNILLHMDAIGATDSWALGMRLSIGSVIALLALIAGRITPAFTRNWLSSRDVTSLPPGFSRLDALAMLILIAGVVAWILAPDTKVTALFLGAAAIATAVRLMRWRGHLTTGEPLLLILHIAYAWLPVGLALLTVSTLGIWSSASALHALTGGAMSTMVLAVMARATLGHTGRPLTADRLTTASFVLITLAALIRVASPFAPDMYDTLIATSGAAWIVAFALFLVRYAPMLLGPNPGDAEEASNS